MNKVTIQVSNIQTKGTSMDKQEVHQKIPFPMDPEQAPKVPAQQMDAATQPFAIKNTKFYDFMGFVSTNPNGTIRMYFGNTRPEGINLPEEVNLDEIIVSVPTFENMVATFMKLHEHAVKTKAEQIVNQLRGDQPPAPKE